MPHLVLTYVRKHAYYSYQDAKQYSGFSISDIHVDRVVEAKKHNRTMAILRWELWLLRLDECLHRVHGKPVNVTHIGDKRS